MRVRLKERLPERECGRYYHDNFSSHLISHVIRFPLGGLPHQSRSYPGGGSGGSGGRTLARNSSVSSQSSLEGATSCSSSHRGSSPQIRAFGPDGRHHARHDPLHAASSYPPSRNSRLAEIYVTHVFIVPLCNVYTGWIGKKSRRQKTKRDQLY